MLIWCVGMGVWLLVIRGGLLSKSSARVSLYCIGDLV
jgi:hypothetical protein